MKRLACLPLCLLFLTTGLFGREFSVLVYNVENLFDLDGVALYEDYRQGEEGDYGTGPLLSKLEAIRTVLATFNDGAGPEVILFQELELDRTPYRTPTAGALLRQTAGIPLETLLAGEEWARYLPSELLLLKYLDDHGMGDYHIAQADPAKMEEFPAHKNVVFSRFPVNFVRQRSSLMARDLVVAGLDVDGHELIVLNNHWKSGASNPEMEPIRVQNARVVRAELDAILYQNPRADVIIAGDFNSYYNHRTVFPDLKETAVNDVLQANGFETRMVVDGSDNLYNLWFELEPDERGSEVYRGYWGTLMQMVITPGLYDLSGIQYVDNSFSRLMIPGENVDSRWGRPLRWTSFGGGTGYSDHLPIYARFRVDTDPDTNGWMELENPGNEELSPHRPVVNFKRMNRMAVPPIGQLSGLPAKAVQERIGELFLVDLPLSSASPARVQAGELELDVYSPVGAVREALAKMEAGDRLRAYADLDAWRGRLQVVIRDESWLFAP